MKTKLLLILGLFAFLTGCFKDEQWDPDPWTHHFNGPILKTNFDLAGITALQDHLFTDRIFSYEIDPIWTGDLAVPPVSGLSSESNAQLFKMTDHIKAIHTDSLIINVNFTNGYPIAFGKGTELVFRNQGNQEIFFRHAVIRDILPTQEYEFQIRILNKEDEPQKVESNIEFYLDNFRSPGTDGQIENFDNAFTRFTFSFEFISIVKLELYPDKEWKDTVNTDFYIFNEDQEQEDLAEGKLVMKMINGMPLNALMDAVILDQDNNVVLDFLDSTMVIEAGEVDYQTTEVLSRSTSTLEVDLPLDKLNLLYKKNRLNIVFSLNTFDITSPEIIMGEESSMKLKVGADLRFYVDELEIE